MIEFDFLLSEIAVGVSGVFSDSCRDFFSSCSSDRGCFAEGDEDFFRVPVVGGVPGYDPAVFADQDGREGVGEGFAVARGDTDVEELCNRGEIFFCGSREVPVEEFFVGVIAGVGAAVAA